jgi:hypothetical protein
LAITSIKTGSSFTNLQKYNDLLGPNPANGDSATWLIERITVGAGGVASVTFSNIPQTYTHLQIRCLSRATAAGTSGSSMSVGFNNDTASSYTTHLISGNGSTVFADANNAFTKNYANITGSSGLTASVFSAQIIDILDYKNTNKNKTIRSLSGFDNNGFGAIRLSSSAWLNTTAINSIKIFEFSNNSFIQYSSFALYGIKG